MTPMQDLLRRARACPSCRLGAGKPPAVLEFCPPHLAEATTLPV